MNTYPKTELNQVKRGAKRASYDVQQVHTILDAGFVGFVSYTFQERAICLPMAYSRIGDKVYLHGSQKNRMLLALLEANEVSMTVMHLDGLVLARSGLHHSVNYRSVTLFGKVKLLTEKSEKTKILKSIVDQMIVGRWETLRPMKDKELKATMVIEVSIETASVKIRDVGVEDEISDQKLPIWAGIVPIKQIAEFPQPDEFSAERLEIPVHVKDYYKKHKR
ncbi:MAG: pyridoxamine 5'-phosphate oxidase family protein [Cellulophaga sp.]